MIHHHLLISGRVKGKRRGARCFRDGGDVNLDILQMYRYPVHGTWSPAPVQCTMLYPIRLYPGTGYRVPGICPCRRPGIGTHLCSYKL